VPSIDNRTTRSVPKFGALCTIKRALGCLPGDGLAVAARLLAWISAAGTAIVQTKARIQKILELLFIPQT
jgi:hypothetical protein